MALAQIQAMTLRQANFLSWIDGFYFLAAAAIAAAVFALWQKEID